MRRRDALWGVFVVATLLGAWGIDHGLGHKRHMMGTVQNRHMAPQSTWIQVGMRSILGDRYFLDVQMPHDLIAVQVDPKDFFQLSYGTQVDVVGTRGEITGWFFPVSLSVVLPP